MSQALDIWKIERDRFYSPLYQQHGLDHIIEAGFFFDTDKIDQDLRETTNVLCTPLGFLDYVKGRQNQCILLSTGSFCPAHSGHIEKMINAKNALESIGMKVIGGYLSPGHDEYISQKNKDKAIPINRRLSMLNDALKGHDWLNLDPWEGVFNRVAVNFTDVIVRLEAYVEKHLGEKIPIYYVCGSDNARFALTFEKEGHCVVVSRPGHDDHYDTYKKRCENDRIIFTEGNNNSSSTAIRNKIDHVAPQMKKLQLRINDHSCDRYVNKILSSHFSEIKKHTVSEQKLQFDGEKNKTISLDSAIESDHNLMMSRQYDLFGNKFIRFTNRPGHDQLHVQIKKIPIGTYDLFDDDIHTGNTMRYAKNFLEDNDIKIRKIMSLNISSPKESEILDARDFILGNEDNGLVVWLPGGTQSRAPYVYPYVDPTIRCSIDDPMGFSINIWMLNEHEFCNSKEGHTLDMYANHVDLFVAAGFKPSDKMSDICKWHVEYLRGLSNS